MPLPALPDQPDELVAIANHWLASLTADEGGIGSALDAAAALDALRNAHRKAGAAEVMEFAYAEAARRAERRLGQLLLESREAGTVHPGGGARANGVDASIPQLGDLGIQSNLAADAAVFARLTDQQWDELMELAREGQAQRRNVLSRSAISTACTRLLASIEDRAAGADAAQQRLLEERRRAEREIQNLLAEVERVPVVTVDEFVEIDIQSMDIPDELDAAIPHMDLRREDPRWSSIRVGEAHEMIVLANKLIARLDDLPASADAPFVSLTITAAQDAAGRLINASTRWASALADLQPEPSTTQLRSV